MYATVIEVAEINGQYGMEKKSRVQLDDGESKTVYTKPKVADIYNALRPGIRVELMTKNSGAGYLIKKIDQNAPAQPSTPAAPNGQAPARAGRQEPTSEEISKYIKTAAGQYAYCVKMLQEKFKKAGVTDITDDLLKAGATSIFIATKDKFH